MTQTIRIACRTEAHLPLDALTPFQGDLKSLANDDSQRLQKEIIETGFAFPIYVWRSPDGKNCIIGGHQRVRVLTELRAQGFEIPELPVVYVDADSEPEAKRRILQDVSQYGRVEAEGLKEFITHLNLDASDLALSFRLPEIDLVKFQNLLSPDAPAVDAAKEWEGMPEFTQPNKKSFRHLVVHFTTAEDAEKFFRLIDQHDTGTTKTVWFPPQERMDTESKRYTDEEPAANVEA